jgi:DNA-binding beta-propeller fold protein YncE
MADVIRKINASLDNVRVLTRNLPASAVISGIDVSANGTVYAMDWENHVVYKIYENGKVEGVLAGRLGLSGDVLTDTINGNSGLDARFNRPFGVCVDRSNNIYVVDRANFKIKRLSAEGRVMCLAGSTVGDTYSDDGAQVQFGVMMGGICVDNAGIVYLADHMNHKIKKIFPSGRTVGLAGNTMGFNNDFDGRALFMYPLDVAVDAAGVVYVADTGNNRIRKITTSGNVYTLAGNGTAGLVDGNGLEAQFSNPTRVALDPSGRFLYVLDTGNQCVRKVTADGKTTTFMPYSTLAGVGDITVDNTGFLYLLENI